MGWVESVRVVEPGVRHLTDFRPFPNARIADVIAEAVSQKDLSHSPKEANNTRPRNPEFARMTALTIIPPVHRKRKHGAPSAAGRQNRAG